MKKFIGFIVTSFIASLPVIIIFTIAFNLFGKKLETKNLTIILITMLIFGIGFGISLIGIVLYEIITSKKFGIGTLNKSRIYEKLLLLRFFCILIIIFYIFNIAFSFIETTSDFYIISIASTLWIISAIYSIPFEENLSGINFKKGLIIGFLSILLSCTFYFGRLGYFFFSEIRAYSSHNVSDTQRLLENRIIIDKALTKTYFNKETPLHIATKNSSVATFILNEAFIYEYTNPQTNLFERVISAKDKNGKTPIDIIKDKKETYKYSRHYISQIEAMKLVKPIRNPNITDKQIIDMIEKNRVYINIPFLVSRQTLLKFAVEEKRIDLIKYLINKGAYVNVIYDENRPSLMTSLYRSATILQIPFGYEYIHRNDKERKIMSFCMFTEEEMYNISKILLENNADPNIVTHSGTAFLMACKHTNNPDLIKLFLSHRANIKSRDVNGYGILESWYNSKEKNFEILDILIKAGADPNEKNPLTNKSFYETIKESTRSDELTKKVSEYLDNYKK